VRACPSCGKDNPADARFCNACGQSLAAETPAAETRKTVTVVFCDVTGSTALGERTDPEALRRLMTRYYDAMRAVVESHGGTVEKFIGDAVMAVFGVPRVHEDDALRAVRASAAMRSALEDLNRDLQREFGVEIQTRIGVNTGEVVAGEPSAGQNLVLGDMVNTAARLEQAAVPGEIMLGEDTYQLVRDAVIVEPVDPLALKGKSGGVLAHRLVEVKPGVEGHVRRMDSPMVGRHRQLGLLRDTFDGTVSDRACGLFTVLGPAGIGKTRLVREFLDGVGDEPLVLWGRCLSYGEGITFWAISEMLASAAGITESDTPERAAERIMVVLGDAHDAERVGTQLAALLGVTESPAGVEPAWAVRRLFETLATRRPLIAFFDDLHWAEPGLLDVIEHMADLAREAPILLLCTARPELLETRPGWGGGMRRATSVHLEPLDDLESEELIGNLLDHPALTSEIRQRIREAARGNPLFVEEMLSMLLDDGSIVEKDGAWVATIDLSTINVPPAISALLAARLDRLSPDERGLLEAASVIGEIFERDAIQTMVEGGIDRIVQGLVRKDLIVPSPSDMGAGDAIRFRHILIRDAAYQAIPKERRADLHEGFAAWIERVGGDRAEEQDEIVGYHLEQAFRYREALGPLDDEARDLARRAAARLAAAGFRALGRYDVAAVANLLGRAEALHDPSDPARIALLPDLAFALWESGSTEESKAVISEALSRAELLGDAEMSAHVSLMRWFLEDDLEGSHDRVRSVAQQAASLFDRTGDEAGLARAWHLIGSVEWDLGQAGKQLPALERALEHAQRAGDAFETAEVILSITAAIVRGPTAVPIGIARAEHIIDRFPANRGAEAYMCHALAHLRARLGEFDAARDAAERYRGFLHDTGQMIGYWRGAEVLFDIEMLAGDAVAADAVAEEAYAKLLERDDRWPYLCAFVAQARFALGRYADAAEVAEVAASSAVAVERALGLGVLARVRAREGDAPAAHELIDEAVAIVERTDFLFDRGTVQLDRAEVMELLSRGDDARTARERALEMFEEKGDLVSAARTRSLLERG